MVHKLVVPVIQPAGGANLACFESSRKRILENSGVISRIPHNTNERLFLEVFKALGEVTPSNDAVPRSESCKIT